MHSKKLLLIVITLMISACRTDYITAPLPLPSMLSSPTVTDAELRCLSDSVYRRLAMRDLACRNYNQRLEAVIQSTWEK